MSVVISLRGGLWDKLRFEWLNDRGGLLGRLLILGVVISMTNAFALTNLFELFLCILFVSDSSLRARLFAALKDTRVMLVMAFWAWIAVTTLWGQAPFTERFQDWWSWRKLLLVPMAFALFPQDIWKRALIFIFIGVCALYMVASWFGTWGLIELNRHPSDILQNHSTQGIFFVSSAFMCFLIARDTTDRYLRLILVALILGFITNVGFILSGRSGYLFLLILGTYGAFVSVQKRRWLIASLVSIIILGFLLTAAVSSDRIHRAYEEIRTAYIPNSEYTSIGIRLVMWNNTLEMIQNKPILGSGAGSYKYDYQATVEGVDGWRGGFTDDPHQQYLHIAAEYGLVGLTVFLLSLCTWLVSKIDSRNLFQLSALGILLGTMANGFANGHFSAFVEGRFIWIFLPALLSGSADTLETHIKKWRRYLDPLTSYLQKQ